MGSLLADSNSKSGFSSPFKLTLRDRNTAKIAAASVEDMTEPSSNPSSQVKPRTTTANAPTKTAVRTTPTVARIIPLPNTGRTLFHSVSRPPAKRM